MRKIFNRKILRFLSTRKIFDPQFIPSTLIFIRRTNEMAFQFRYFSHPIPDTTSKLFNLAKWLLDMAVRSNRFHNWRQFIRGFSLSLSLYSTITRLIPFQSARTKIPLGRLFIIIILAVAIELCKKDGRTKRNKTADTC